LDDIDVQRPPEMILARASIISGGLGFPLFHSFFLLEPLFEKFGVTHGGKIDF
jgi:hypothetical protein